LLFPIKFKFEMVLVPEPTPTAFGFAGGIEITDDNSNSLPVLSAYTQV
jgi:hypothetical protein